ncbi:Retrovirus-related Pol polyprotein from transposon TNT 1-94 [Glycine soja]
MKKSRLITEQLVDFNKVLNNLENIEVRFDDENKAFFILNSLPKSFKHFKDALLYRRNKSITLEEVQNSIQTKKLQKLQELKADDNEEGLNILKGRSYERGPKRKKSRSKSRSKSKLKCFNYHKNGHFKKDYLEKWGKEFHGS